MIKNVKKQLISASFLLLTVAAPTSPYANPPQDYTVPVITCAPRPACLDANPPCKIVEPISGWCNNIPVTCAPRPACLDANPPCKIMAPNLCPPVPTLTPVVFPNSCGGDKPAVCPTGYTCLYGKDINKGGKCVSLSLPTAPVQNKTTPVAKEGILQVVWKFFISFFKH